MAFGIHGILWDLIPDAYFFIDHILALNTGYYINNTLVTDRRKVFERYISHEIFISGEDRWNLYVFIIEFIPYYLCIIVDAFHPMDFWVLSLCSIPRCRRLYDLLAFFHEQEVGMYQHSSMVVSCLDKVIQFTIRM